MTLSKTKGMILSDYSAFPPSLAAITKALDVLESSTIPNLHAAAIGPTPGTADEVIASAALAAALDVYRELYAQAIKITNHVAVSPT